MRKFLLLSSLLIGLLSCNGSTENNTSDTDTTNQAGLTNPSAIDTTKHPDGMINGSVISTDTAAMNTQNAIDKAKGAKKEK